MLYIKVSKLNIKYLLLIHPSISYTCLIPVKVAGGLEPVPAAITRYVGYTRTGGQLITGRNPYY